MYRSIHATVALLSLAVFGLAACEQPGSEPAAPVETGTTIDPNAPLVRARLPDNPIRVGDSFEIEILVDNFPDNEGGGMTLRFDPALIRVNRVEFAAGWNFVTDAGVIDNAAGEVRDILFSSFAHAGGAAAIVVLDVTAIGAGRSEIGMLESGENPFASAGRRFTVRFVEESIRVNPRG